ncbi:MAG: hypothetical protein R2749_11680 [Acidimicrobiales bacterium]
MGDVLTIPALWAAAQLVDIRFFSPALSALLIGLSLGLSVMAWRSPLDTLRRTVRESAPVLLLAAALSSLAGVALEKRLEIFDTYGALFVLQPAFVSSAGAMGGILASRLATAFQVGTLDPDGVPSRGSRQLASVVLALAAPVALYKRGGQRSPLRSWASRARCVLAGGVARRQRPGDGLSWSAWRTTPRWSPPGSVSTPTTTARRWSPRRSTSSVPWR